MFHIYCRCVLALTSLGVLMCMNKEERKGRKVKSTSQVINKPTNTKHFAKSIILNKSWSDYQTSRAWEQEKKTFWAGNCITPAVGLELFWMTRKWDDRGKVYLWEVSYCNFKFHKYWNRKPKSLSVWLCLIFSVGTLLMLKDATASVASMLTNMYMFSPQYQEENGVNCTLYFSC